MGQTPSPDDEQPITVTLVRVGVEKEEDKDVAIELHPSWTVQDITQVHHKATVREGCPEGTKPVLIHKGRVMYERKRVEDLEVKKGDKVTVAWVTPGEEEHFKVSDWTDEVPDIDKEALEAMQKTRRASKVAEQPRIDLESRTDSVMKELQKHEDLTPIRQALERKEAIDDEDGDDEEVLELRSGDEQSDFSEDGDDAEEESSALKEINAVVGLETGNHSLLTENALAGTLLHTYYTEWIEVWVGKPFRRWVGWHREEKKHEEEMAKPNNSAVMIQKVYRGMKERQAYAYNLPRHRGAVRIQKHYRGYAVRKTEPLVKLPIKFVRKAFGWESSRTGDAFIWWKKWGMESTNRYLKLKEWGLELAGNPDAVTGAVRVQSHFRGHSVRRRGVLGKMRAEDSAATDIQASYRGYAWRKNNKAIVEELQERHRWINAGGSIHPSEAASRIQSFFRGYWERQNMPGTMDELERRRKERQQMGKKDLVRAAQKIDFVVGNFVTISLQKSYGLWRRETDLKRMRKQMEAEARRMAGGISEERKAEILRMLLGDGEGVEGSGKKLDRSTSVPNFGSEKWLTEAELDGDDDNQGRPTSALNGKGDISRLRKDLRTKLAIYFDSESSSGMDGDDGGKNFMSEELRSILTAELKSAGQEIDLSGVGGSVKFREGFRISGIVNKGVKNRLGQAWRVLKRLIAKNQISGWELAALKTKGVILDWSRLRQLALLLEWKRWIEIDNLMYQMAGKKPPRRRGQPYTVEETAASKLSEVGIEWGRRGCVAALRKWKRWNEVETILGESKDTIRRRKLKQMNAQERAEVDQQPAQVGSGDNKRQRSEGCALQHDLDQRNANVGGDGERDEEAEGNDGGDGDYFDINWEATAGQLIDGEMSYRRPMAVKLADVVSRWFYDHIHRVAHTAFGFRLKDRSDPAVMGGKSNNGNPGDDILRDIAGLSTTTDETPEERQAATKIQSRYRGNAARKQQKEREEAALKIQRNVKGFNVRKTVGRKSGVPPREIAQRREASAVKIQSRYRGNKARTEKSERDNAAKVIQSNFRGFSTRSKVGRKSGIAPAEAKRKKNEAAQTIQKRARGNAARRHHNIEEQKAAATTIQSSFRKMKAKETTAATKIQSRYRGNAARKQQKEREEAALKIQRNVKGFNVRKTVGRKSGVPPREIAQRREASAVKIQSRYRGNKARTEKSERDNAAKVIQKRHRKRAVQIKQSKQDEAVTTIQRIYRGRLGRAEAQEHREVRTIAATQIQAVYRGSAVRRGKHENEQRRKIKSESEVVVDRITLMTPPPDLNFSAILRHMLVNTFHKYDRNKSGTLSRGELRTLLTQSNFIGKKTKASAQIDRLLALMDADEDGGIDKDEFVLVMLHWLLPAATPPTNPGEATADVGAEKEKGNEENLESQRPQSRVSFAPADPSPPLSPSPSPSPPPRPPSSRMSRATTATPRLLEAERRIDLLSQELTSVTRFCEIAEERLQGASLELAKYKQQQGQVIIDSPSRKVGEEKGGDGNEDGDLNRAQLEEMEAMRRKIEELTQYASQQKQMVSELREHQEFIQQTMANHWSTYVSMQAAEGEDEETVALEPSTRAAEAAVAEWEHQHATEEFVFPHVHPRDHGDEIEVKAQTEQWIDEGAAPAAEGGGLDTHEVERDDGEVSKGREVDELAAVVKDSVANEERSTSDARLDAEVSVTKDDVGGDAGGGVGQVEELPSVDAVQEPPTSAVGVGATEDANPIDVAKKRSISPTPLEEEAQVSEDAQTVAAAPSGDEIDEPMRTGAGEVAQSRRVGPPVAEGDGTHKATDLSQTSAPNEPIGSTEPLVRSSSPRDNLDRLGSVVSTSNVIRPDEIERPLTVDSERYEPVDTHPFTRAEEILASKQLHQSSGDPQELNGKSDVDNASPLHPDYDFDSDVYRESTADVVSDDDADSPTQPQPQPSKFEVPLSRHPPEDVFLFGSKTRTDDSDDDSEDEQTDAGKPEQMPTSGSPSLSSRFPPIQQPRGETAQSTPHQPQPRAESASENSTTLPPMNIPRGRANPWAPVPAQTSSGGNASEREGETESSNLPSEPLLLSHYGLLNASPKPPKLHPEADRPLSSFESKSTFRPPPAPLTKHEPVPPPPRKSPSVDANDVSHNPRESTHVNSPNKLRRIRQASSPLSKSNPPPEVSEQTPPPVSEPTQPTRMRTGSVADLDKGATKVLGEFQDVSNATTTLRQQMMDLEQKMKEMSDGMTAAVRSGNNAIADQPEKRGIRAREVVGGAESTDKDNVSKGPLPSRPPPRIPSPQSKVPEKSSLGPVQPSSVQQPHQFMPQQVPFHQYPMPYPAPPMAFAYGAQPYPGAVPYPQHYPQQYYTPPHQLQSPYIPPGAQPIPMPGSSPRVDLGGGMDHLNASLSSSNNSSAYSQLQDHIGSIPFTRHPDQITRARQASATEDGEMGANTDEGGDAPASGKKDKYALFPYSRYNLSGLDPERDFTVFEPRGKPKVVAKDAEELGGDGYEYSYHSKGRLAADDEFDDGLTLRPTVQPEAQIQSSFVNDKVIKANPRRIGVDLNRSVL